MSAPANVAGLLVRLARERADRPALVAPGGRRITFGELHEQVARLSAGLARAGLGPGDRVLVLVPMSFDLYRALLALFHLGATAVLLDPSAPRVGSTLERLDLRAFVGSPAAHLLRLRHPALRRIPLQVSTGFTPLPHRRLRSLSGPPAEPAAVPADRPALLTFTTGTTGRPKALGRTHPFLLAQHRVLRDHMGIGPGDVDLPTLPVFLLNSLAAGATAVLPDADLRHVGRVRPARVAAQLVGERCTTTSGSPAFLGPVAAWLRARGDVLPDLRRVFTGGARVPVGVLEDLVATAPLARVEVLYGSTEAEPIASIDAREVIEETAAAEAEGRGTCVGRPVPGIDLRILRPGADEPVRPGEVGEVAVAGEHVNPGDFEDPEAAAACRATLDGRRYLRLGDAGRLDARGRLWLVGRVGQDVGGRWPFCVEAPVERLPGVRRAALVEVEGAAVLAVERDGEPLPAGWEAALAREHGVDRVVEVPAVPVDPRHNAKVDRPALVRLLAGSD